MGAAAPSPLTLPLLPLAAAAVFTGLVALARSLRRLYRWAAGRLRRWMGPRAANALGWAAVVAGTWLVASGLLLNGLAGLADRSFSVRNTTTAVGVEAPVSALRSGGPGSLVSWASLGRQGRTIAGTGPTAQSGTLRLRLRPVALAAGEEPGGVAIVELQSRRPSSLPRVVSAIKELEADPLRDRRGRPGRMSGSARPPRRPARCWRGSCSGRSCSEAGSSSGGRRPRLRRPRQPRRLLLGDAADPRPAAVTGGRPPPAATAASAGTGPEDGAS